MPRAIPSRDLTKKKRERDREIEIEMSMWDSKAAVGAASNNYFANGRTLSYEIMSS